MIDRIVSARARETSGLTTLGMIISLVLLGLFLSPLIGTIIGAQRGFVTTQGRARATSNVRYAHLALTRVLRAAGSNPIAGGVQAIDPDPDADGIFNDVRLRSDFNPPDGDTNDPGEDLRYYLRADTMYVQPDGGAEQPYLIGVDSLAFEYYDRDGVAITDAARIASRGAISAQITLRARSRTYQGEAERVLVGHVRFRNGR